MIVVPTTSSHASYRQVVALGSRLFRLTFRWNGRDSAWYVAVETEAGVALTQGRALRLDWPMLRQLVGELLPTGDLFALDVDGTRVEPGRGDLAGRVPVLFAETGEIARG